MVSKKNNKNSPRIKIIQKIYNSLMNPEASIEYPKNQYKKYIKDVVSGTLERSDLIEQTIYTNLNNDIDLKKTDKILKIILFAAVFELLFKHNNPKKVVIRNIYKPQNTFRKSSNWIFKRYLDKISKCEKDE